MTAAPFIAVFRHRGAYLARLSDAASWPSDPCESLPTAFTSQADPLVVLGHVAADNPASDVVLAPATAETPWTVAGRVHFRDGTSWN